MRVQMERLQKMKEQLSKKDEDTYLLAQVKLGDVFNFDSVHSPASSSKW